MKRFATPGAALRALVAACAIVLSAAVAGAQDSAIRIEQIGGGRASSIAFTAPDETEPELPTFVFDVLRQLPPARTADQSQNSSVVDQRGVRNRAVLSVEGRGNATRQNQRGTLLNSQLAIRGMANRVLVDQEGSGLDSEIGLVNAARKSVVHIMRGSESGPTAQEIRLTGTEPEFLIVLDTPMGRITRRPEAGND